jgi:hypothetical protein
MGAQPWTYFVPYQPDLSAALEALREREFRAGRFFQPTEVPPGFFGRLLGRPPTKAKPPASVREAIKLAGATGTRSILDMEKVGGHFECGVVASLPGEELRRLFGTDQPARKNVENSEALVEELDRGQGVAVVTYAHGNPDGILFFGYSYD